MQNCGPGDDNITLDCTIAPQVTGPISGLDRLRQMMADGKAWILTAGSGDVMGPWVITGIDETRRHLLKDGTPRRIDFTLSLSSYPEDQPQGLGRLRDSLPTPDFSITAAGIDVTAKIRRGLVSLSLADKRRLEADQLTITIADPEWSMALPATGFPAPVLGVEGKRAVDKDSSSSTKCRKAARPIASPSSPGRLISAILKQSREQSYNDTTLSAVLRACCLHGLKAPSPNWPPGPLPISARPTKATSTW